MAFRQMNIAVRACDDGDWCITLTRSTYENGARVACDLVDNRWTDLERVRKVVSEQLDTLIALEQGRIRKVDATGRSMPLQRP